MTLMQRLLNAGYPREEMFNHESDLYVYVTPLTQKVINEFCEEYGYDKNWQCPIFINQIDGELMFDCAFCYDDYWNDNTKFKEEK